MSILPGWAMAFCTAVRVISLKVMRKVRVVVQTQGVLDVPGDGLALAVGVGRQEDVVGLGRLALQLGQDVLGACAGRDMPLPLLSSRSTTT